MLKSTLIIITIGCGLLFLIGTFLGIREWLLVKVLYNQSLSQLPIKKTIFCRLVLEWCHENIKEPNTTRPAISINYYKHKKLGGVYYPRVNECVIYVNSHQTVIELVNCIIHEYTHAKQRGREINRFQETYDRLLLEFDYDQHPLEIEARTVADKYEKECLLWVYSQIKNPPR